MYNYLYYIFIHLKLEIALAIPASNEGKYNTRNSAAEELTRRWGVEYVPLILLVEGMHHP